MEERGYELHFNSAGLEDLKTSTLDRPKSEPQIQPHKIHSLNLEEAWIRIQTSLLRTSFNPELLIQWEQWLILNANFKVCGKLSFVVYGLIVTWTTLPCTESPLRLKQYILTQKTVQTSDDIINQNTTILIINVYITKAHKGQKQFGPHCARHCNSLSLSVAYIVLLYIHI